MTNPAKKAPEFANETVLNIPFGEIFADYAWNVRSLSDISDVSDAVRDTTVKGSASEGAGMAEFAKNFAEVGQDTPAIVREVQNGKTLSGKTTKAKYELVAGFRRMTAVKLCNEDKDLVAAADKAGKPYVPTQPNGTLRAVVRTFATERDARVLNIRENTARNNLKTPDLVLQVRTLAKEGMSQVAIADAIGVTQGFVSKLLKVATLPASVLQHWRNGNASPLPGLPADKVYNRVPMPDLATLADLQATDKLPESEVIGRYVEMVNPTPAEGSTGSGATKEEKDAARVVDFAKMVATLVHSGFLAPGDLQWTKVIGPKSANFMVDAGSKDYAKVMEKCDLAARSYSEHLAELSTKKSA
jgi:ParB-like chromosome segregation protein Spo0J